MELTRDPTDAHRAVRWCRADAIQVDADTLESSFLLTPRELVPGWAPRSVAELDVAALESLLRLEPELVLLGTGQRQQFPAPSVLGYFLSRRIGVEVMDNAGAARTFNLLAGEGRRVVAAFLLPGEKGDKEIRGRGELSARA